MLPCDLDHIQHTGASALSASDLLDGQIQLPVLAVAALVPGVRPLLPPPQQIPLAVDAHCQRKEAQG